MEKIPVFIGIVLIGLSSFCFSQAKKDEVTVQSFDKMQNEIAYPTPNKDCFQKILQKCSDDLYLVGFREFSQDDFFHGHILHYLKFEIKTKPKDYQLAGILWHTQEWKKFNIANRSWVQWFSPDNEVQRPILASRVIREKSWDLMNDYKFLQKHGTVFPSLLSKDVVSYVTVYFYPIDGTDQLAASDKNVIKISLKNKSNIFLVVEYKKF